MWKVSVCLLLVSIHANQIRANGVGWGSGDSGSNQATNTQYNSGRDTSITSLPQYENSPKSPGTGTNENYWWLKENPFQKPPNHPGVEKGVQSSGSPAPGASNSNYGTTHNSATITGSYNPSNQQTPSYAPSNAFPQKQIPQRQPAPQFQQNQNSGSYGGSSAPGSGWSGPSNPSAQPSVSSPVKPIQNYRPPQIDFNSDCQLTNKADCHAGAPPVINPVYNQVDTPSSSNSQKYPEIGASSYTESKPQIPASPNVPSDNSYGNSPPSSYYTPNTQPAPQSQPVSQIPSIPTPAVQALPQAEPSPVGSNYQVLSSPGPNYNTGSSSYGSSASEPVVQPQPSYSTSGSGWSAPTPSAQSPSPNNFPQKPSYSNGVSNPSTSYNSIQPSQQSASSSGQYQPNPQNSGQYQPTSQNSGQYQPSPQNSYSEQYQPSPQNSNSGQNQPSPQSSNSGQYQPNAQNSGQYQPSPQANSNSGQYQSNAQNSGQYQPSPQANSNSGQYQPKPYNPAANNLAQPNPPPYNNNYRPAPQPTPTGNANNFGDQLPYPGCPAAMLCVPDNQCNAKGVIEERPITLSAAELMFRVALVACSAPSTGEVGVCCRDPNYKDPWPDMNGNGGNKQHHHHDNSQVGSGGFNPGNPQPAAVSQPSQNFNSYSGTGNTGIGGGWQSGCKS